LTYLCTSVKIYYGQKPKKIISLINLIEIGGIAFDGSVLKFKRG